MLAKKYKSELISILNPFEGIYTLEFKSLGRKYKYKPGQFLHLAIDEDYDGIGQWPESRCFSIQSAPGENAIKITYAVKGDFTKEMASTLKEGKEVWLKLPYGDLFQQDHNKRNTVFIAGGTGLTPYLSLFTDSAFSLYENPKVYMGFRERSLQIYNNELELAKKNCASVFSKNYYQDTDGVIDIAQILSESDISSSFFISGPPVMIKNFKEYLITNGVEEEQVKTDDWE